MAISATAVFLVLASLVARLPGTVQTYQDAVEVLNSIPFDEMEEEQGRAEESGDLFTELWTDIEDAFRFLEERQVEEDLRRLKMMEISKRFPIRRHNFVRFGKRYQPTHNFVRFGRSSSASGARAVSQAGAVAKRGSYPFSNFPVPDEVFGDPSSIYPTPDAASQGWLAAQGAEDTRGPVFLRLSRAAEDANLETSGDELRKRNLNSFVRIGRSVPGWPKEVSQAEGGFEIPDGSILSILKKQAYDTARIGRVPAALYLNRPTSEQTYPSTPRGGAGYNEYHRYG
ncbi:unnamed protein product [Lymnaea stagnalis]|uniref:Uncharacterized protein n=1 Tax=Lymnaea stagnalis TaxID=6523 RepID=A0AAV2HM07_LYMST